VDIETIEILKNPHDNRKLLTSDLLKGCGLSYVNRCGSHVSITYEGDHTIHINLHQFYITEDGMFNFWEHKLDRGASFLENYFEFPLLPTKEERELFYIEHGFEYPIPVYEGEL